MLQINNKILETHTAELVAQIPDPYWVDTYSPDDSKEIVWMLNILCQSKTTDNAATLSHDNIRIKSKSWKRLKGTIIAWKEQIDEFGETPASLMLDDEEIDLHTGQIIIGGRKKNIYSVEWTSKQKPRFQLTTQVEFKGVTVRASELESKNDVEKRILQFLSLDEFVCGRLTKLPQKYQSGIKMSQMFLTPSV